MAFSTWAWGWVGAMHRSQPPINRPQGCDSVSVMREGRGIQPPRRQERQGGEKRHGWIGHERYGWARAQLPLAPVSQSSWRPWRLGGSSGVLGLLAVPPGSSASWRFFPSGPGDLYWWPRTDPSIRHPEMRLTLPPLAQAVPASRCRRPPWPTRRASRGSSIPQHDASRAI